MGYASKKFVSRASRYDLRPNDDQIMRFAHKDDKDQSFATRFVNISMTGLAFVTDKGTAPQIGDQIKIEFPTKNGKTIAWWAQVARVEEFETSKWWAQHSDFRASDNVLIGVRFQELPKAHMREIQDTINEKFKSESKDFRDDKFRRGMYYISEHFWRFTLVVVFALLMILTLYFLSIPSENYDPKKGTPWGERFRF